MTAPVAPNIEDSKSLLGGGRLNVGDSYGVTRMFEPNRLLLTEGLGSRVADSVKVSPDFGFGRVVQHRELGMGRKNVMHRVHAGVGGTVQLFETLYFSASGKVPLYNYEFIDQRVSGGSSIVSGSAKHQYEVLSIANAPLTWSGEMGVRMGKSFDLNIFYDQNHLKNQWTSNGMKQEDVIGTRLILWFK